MLEHEALQLAVLQPSDCGSGFIQVRALPVWLLACLLVNLFMPATPAISEHCPGQIWFAESAQNLSSESHASMLSECSPKIKALSVR